LRPSTVTTPSTNRSSPSPRTKRWCTSPPGTSTPPASPRSRWRGFAVGSGVRAGRSLARTGARQTRHARDRAQPVPGRSSQRLDLGFSHAFINGVMTSPLVIDDASAAREP
jgi:hypothetical protein